MGGRLAFRAVRGPGWPMLVLPRAGNEARPSGSLDHPGPHRPKVRGGTNERRNLVGACRPLRGLKADMSEAEFRRWYPTPESRIEAAWPMAGFNARVSQRPAHAPLCRRLTAAERGWGDPEAEWQARLAAIGAPVRPLAPGVRQLPLVWRPRPRLWRALPAALGRDAVRGDAVHGTGRCVQSLGAGVTVSRYS